MKIAIIVPKSLNKKQSYKEYPLGVGYIGTILLNKGHEVIIYDQNVEYSDNRELVDEVMNNHFDLIGFSILTATYPNTLKILRSLQARAYAGKYFVGGIHASLFPEDCLEVGIDYVIKGEGEIPVEKLVDYLEGKVTLKEVPNTAYRENGQVINEENVILDIHVNKLPIVNRDLFRVEKYDSHSISGTRGCPFGCKFCCNYNHLTNISVKNRIRTVESIMEEIRYLVTYYEAKEIFFTDDVFLGNIKNLRSFTQGIIDLKGMFKFSVQLRINMVTDEVCTLLKQAGCSKIEVGVEAGSEQILNDACKGIKIQDIIKGIAIAKQHHLCIKTNWIYGLPGNMEEQYKAIDLMVKTKPHQISIHQLIPFPGTAYYDQREVYGIHIEDPKNFESFCYGDLDENISYSYMSRQDYNKLMYDTIVALEKEGYVSSDQATVDSEYIFTTPFDKNSLTAVI